MKKDLLASQNVTIFEEEYELNLSEDTEVSIENLSEDLSRQPGLLAYYGELKVRAQRQLNETKAMLDLFMAEERNKIRAATEGKRLYKEDLTDQIFVKQDFITLSDLLRKAEHTFEKVSAAYAAVKDKGMALNSMASIYKAEIFVNDKVMEETFRERRKKLYDKTQKS
jgi:hypothetical protein